MRGLHSLMAGRMRRDTTIQVRYLFYVCTSCTICGTHATRILANGDVTWSSSSSLAYVNSADQAIIKVDNSEHGSPDTRSCANRLTHVRRIEATTVAYNDKRNSVKLLSNNWYKPGTVFVMDAVQSVRRIGTVSSRPTPTNRITVCSFGSAFLLGVASGRVSPRRPSGNDLQERQLTHAPSDTSI